MTHDDPRQRGGMLAANRQKMQERNFSCTLIFYLPVVMAKMQVLIIYLASGLRGN